jgi:uncharacterized phage-like protein YoqJ
MSEPETPHIEQPAIQAPVLYLAVTGHRPDKLGGYKTPNPTFDLVLKGLYEAFLHFKPAYVLTGMALGTDQWAAELCVTLGIPFVAALPFQNMDAKWPPHSKSKFHWLLERASAKYIICDGEYEPWKMQARNKWMIDNCHQVVAVFNGSKGGTANCIGYAIERGKAIHYVPLPPAGMEVGDFFMATYGPNQKPQTTEQSPQPIGPGKRIVEI